MGGHLHALGLQSQVCLVTFHSAGVHLHPSEELPFPVRCWVIQGQAMGERNFPVSGDGADLHSYRRVLKDSVPRTRECLESPCLTFHVADQDTETQSHAEGHTEITDGVFGWNPKRGSGKSSGFGSSLVFKSQFFYL